MIKAYNVTAGRNGHQRICDAVNLVVMFERVCRMKLTPEGCLFLPWSPRASSARRVDAGRQLHTSFINVTSCRHAVAAWWRRLVAVITRISWQRDAISCRIWSSEFSNRSADCLCWRQLHLTKLTVTTAALWTGLAIRRADRKVIGHLNRCYTVKYTWL